MGMNKKSIMFISSHLKENLQEFLEPELLSLFPD